MKEGERVSPDLYEAAANYQVPYDDEGPVLIEAGEEMPALPEPPDDANFTGQIEDVTHWR